MTDARLLAAGVFWLAFGMVFLAALGLARRARERHWASLRAAGVVAPREAGRGGVFAGLRAEAEAAGLDVPAGHLAAALVAGMAVGFVGGLAVTGGLHFALAGAALGLFAPRWWVRRKIEGRTRAFEEQLEKGVSAMAASLHAGSNTVQALEEAARQTEPPLRDVLLHALSLMRTGRTLVEALEEAGRKVRSRDMETVAAAVAVNVRTGASLTAVLDRVAESVRDRRAFRAAVAAKTAEARISANVLAAVPLVFLTLFHLMNPEYMAPLLKTFAGNVVLGWALFMFLLGWVLVRRMMEIRY